MTTPYTCLFVDTGEHRVLVDTGAGDLGAHADRVFPGLDHSTSGHTPGHTALSIASEDERLLHVSDAVLYPLHLEHPEWTPVFDMLPERASAGKRRIFDLASEENALVFVHHYPPFPDLGHVRKQERGWRGQPLETQ